MLLKKLPNGKFNSVEHESRYMQEFLAIFDSCLQDLEKYVLCHLIYGDSIEVTSDDQLILDEDIKLEVSRKMIEYGVPTLILSNQQLALVEGLIDLIITYWNAKGLSPEEKLGGSQWQPE
jgi:hypothetical protein